MPRADAETADRMLRAVAAGQPAVPPRPGVRRAVAITAAVIAVLLAATAGVIVWQRGRAPVEASPAAPPSPSSPSISAAGTTQPPAGIDPATWFRLVNLKSGKCIGVRGDDPAERTPIQQLTCGTTKGQHFRVIPTSAGNARIASRLDSLKSLDQFSCNGTAAQSFRLEKV